MTTRNAIPHRPVTLRLTLLACMLFAAVGPVLAEQADAPPRTLLYLPSASPDVDHAAIVQSLQARGFDVRSVVRENNDKAAYVRRVRDGIREMLAQGTPPESITVLGSGDAATLAALASSATGNRRVNYVLLGRCEARLADAPRFHLSGRVLGMRDADDRAAGSCRPLWRDAPRLGMRRDLVVDTGRGAALFDAPYEAWLGPVTEWGRGSHVGLGAPQVASVR